MVGLSEGERGGRSRPKAGGHQWPLPGVFSVPINEISRCQHVLRKAHHCRRYGAIGARRVPVGRRHRIHASEFEASSGGNRSRPARVPAFPSAVHRNRKTQGAQRPASYCTDRLRGNCPICPARRRRYLRQRAACLALQLEVDVARRGFPRGLLGLIQVYMSIRPKQKLALHV